MPAFVRVSESARDLQRDRERFVEREPAAIEARLQRFAFVERHRDEQLSVVGLADLVDRADVRVIERRRGARFRDESRLGVRVGAQMRRQKLRARRDGRAARPALGTRRPCRRRRAAPARGIAPIRRPDHSVDRFRQPRAGRLHERRQPIDDALAVVGEQQRLHFAPESGVAGAAGVERARGAARTRGSRSRRRGRPARAASARRRRIARRRRTGSRLQLPIQPRSCRCPLAFDGRRRDLQRVGGLLHAHPAVRTGIRRFAPDARSGHADAPALRRARGARHRGSRRRPRRRRRGEAASGRRRVSAGPAPRHSRSGCAASPARRRRGSASGSAT